MWKGSDPNLCEISHIFFSKWSLPFTLITLIFCFEICFWNCFEWLPSPLWDFSACFPCDSFRIEGSHFLKKIYDIKSCCLLSLSYPLKTLRLVTGETFPPQMSWSEIKIIRIIYLGNTRLTPPLVCEMANFFKPLLNDGIMQRKNCFR